jgi:hypothetical protein
MTTLARIRTCVRNITGMQDSTQLTDANLDNYINDFYLYDFPERLKTLKLEEFIEFDLLPNIDTYDSDTYGVNVFNVKPPAYVAGYQQGYYQSPEQFYRVWPDTRFAEQVSTGNGGVTYTFTLSNTPVLRNTILINTGSDPSTSLSANDDGDGSWTGNIGIGVNAIDYATGICTITFDAAVPVGQEIVAQYWPYVASRPRDVMFFDQKFVFRPVPDMAYSFRIVANLAPTALISSTDSPEFNEWWQYIAYGAALKIFIEQSNHEEYQRLYPIFREQNNLAQRRTLKQLTNQRTPTPYGESTAGSAAFWPIYPIY